MSLASEGERILSPSSARRRLIRLEGLGLVKRLATLGGNGRSSSAVALVHRHRTESTRWFGDHENAKGCNSPLEGRILICEP
jgi:hypothetical protein